MVKGWKIKALTTAGNIILKTNLQKDKRVNIEILEEDPHIVQFKYNPIDDKTKQIIQTQLTNKIEEEMLKAIKYSMMPCIINKDYSVEVLT